MHVYLRALLFVLLFFAKWQAIAQAPQLLLHGDDGWDSPMHIKEMHVKTVIISDRAFTTFRLTYDNPSGTAGTGTFRFHLQEGQDPRRFAIKLPSGWREAEIVERTKDEVAIHASPFFSEHHFRQYLFEEDVFRIEKGQHYELIFTYEEKLMATPHSYRYHLPIALETPADSFSIEVDGLIAHPVIEGSEYQDMNFEQEQGILGAAFRRTNFSSISAFSMDIPRKGPIESYVGRGKVTDDYYFYTNVSLEDSMLRKKPARVCLIWDQSHSGGQKDVEKEIDLLNQYFTSLGEFELELISFTTQIENKRTYHVRGGNWNDAIQLIRSFKYDGATDFGCLNLPETTCDLIIISTDGDATIGESHLPLSTTPVISLLSSETTNLKIQTHHSLFRL